MINLHSKPAKVTWSNVRKSFVWTTAVRKLHILIKPIETVSVCVFEVSSCVSFGKFTTILNQIYKLSTTRASIHTTISYCIIFYHFIFVCTTTAAANFLSRTSTVFNMPLFLSVLIMKVGLEVRTTTLAEGGITGTTKCNLTVTDVTRLLLTLDFEMYLKLIASSPFSSYNTQFDYEQVLAKIRSTLPEFTGYFDVESGVTLADEDKLFFQMFGFFTLLPSIFHNPAKSLETVDFSLERGYSKYINIHRFRNYVDETCYVVNAQSISTLHSSSQTEFACFLKLFNPAFFQDNTCLFGLNKIIPNDVLLDLSSITEEQALTYLFELTRTSSTGSAKPTNNRRFNDSTVRPTRGTTNDDVNDMEVSSEVKERRKKYKDKFLKIDNSVIDDIVGIVVSSILSKLRSEQSTNFVSSFETGTGTVYYYSPNKLKVPISKMNTEHLISF